METQSAQPGIAKRVPPSLEDLIRKKAEEKNAIVKPVFLSKEERARIALERRQREVDEQRQLQDQERRATAAFFSHKGGHGSTAVDSQQRSSGSWRDARSDRRDTQDDSSRRDSDVRDRDIDRSSRSGRDRDRDRTRESDRDRDRDRDRGRERDRIKEKDIESQRDRKKEESTGTKPKEGYILLEEKELSAIRERFMGAERKKRKIRRMNEKKFVFDWDQAEDTSKDINPIYANRHAAQLFGRGLIAGIDIKAQKKERASFYANIVQDRQSAAELDRAQELVELQTLKDRKVAHDERHWSDKPLTEMKDRDWRIFKEDFSISTKGGNIPNPLRSWSESNLSEDILGAILRIGYKEPTPIQRQAIPMGLQNRDIIGVAETGSGKTASFVIPMLKFITEMPPLTEINSSQGPYALILAPTRELAQQIESETSKFAKEMGFICVSIVGGHAVEGQAFNLRNGAHIIIATPGRLRDCLEQRILVLSQCTYVVMDEADRMVDMGFEPDLKFILDAMPVSNIKPDTDESENVELLRELTGKVTPFRQTVMFSATMPVAVERLAKSYLRRPATVTIGIAGQVVDRIEQRVEMINDDGKKMSRLQELLSGRQFEPPMIVFVNQKKDARLYHGRWILKSTTLHGGKSQEQREASLLGLKQGTKDILVATDVAGRGIDVKNVSVVINFDMAKSIEDYTHRIGRTGRAGKKGVAITFLSNSDADVMYDLRQMILKSPISKIPPELARHEVMQSDIKKTIQVASRELKPV
ncbi:hypothetical protein BASA60_010468 [Batrachochytrium salamandrivorans]|nr:hypothetical protein BASA60_010468 [Batrachochytrium salamandrivorans]